MLVEQLNGGDFSQAMQAFIKLQAVGTPSRFHLNTLMKILAKKDVQLTLDVFYQWMAKGIKPNAVTLDIITSIMSKSDTFDIDQIIKYLDEFTASILIMYFVKRKDVKGAMSTFRKIQKSGVKITSVTVSNLLTAHLYAHDPTGMLETYNWLVSENLPISEVSFRIIKKLLNEFGTVEQRDQVIKDMEKAGIVIDLETYNSKLNDLRKEKHSVCLKYYNEFKNKVKPDAKTFKRLLSTCELESQIGYLIGEMVSFGISVDSDLCGSIGIAYAMVGDFSKMWQYLTKMNDELGGWNVDICRRLSFTILKWSITDPIKKASNSLLHSCRNLSKKTLLNDQQKSLFSQLLTQLKREMALGLD